jgi:hypothetical protein
LNERAPSGDIQGMTTICRSISLAVLGIATAAGTARGADVPLVVAVEVGPGVDIGPADVRQIVAAELGTPVIGSRESTTAGASDVLLVSLEPHEIRMSLRAGAAPILSRTIAAPPDRPGRLRSIGWLAGNLVRDQVGPIVSSGEARPPVALAPSATEPPAQVPIPALSGSAGPAAVAETRRASRPDPVTHSPWAFTASGGPTLRGQFSPSYRDLNKVDRGTAYHVEVQHQASPDSLLFGVALEVGPDAPEHYGGVAVFVGSGWQRRSWFTEGNFGLGVEVLDGRVRRTMATNSSTTGTTTETTVTLEPIPGLYARVQGTVGVHIAQAFDLVAQLGVHLASGGLGGSFLGSTVGMRLRLP